MRPWPLVTCCTLLACGSTSRPDAAVTVDAGDDAGSLVEDAGVSLGDLDAGVFLGERCDPALALELTSACGLSPRNSFQDPGCLTLPLADGGAPDPQTLATFTQQGLPESCAYFGAAKLRCLEGEFRACRMIRVDGGVAERTAYALVALQRCSALLGPRFNGPCVTSCDTAQRDCVMGCPRVSLEQCSDCTWDCGRRFTGCARTCLLLPDAGFLDGGP
jgi:hypothetical protein